LANAYQLLMNELYNCKFQSDRLGSQLTCIRVCNMHLVYFIHIISNMFQDRCLKHFTSISTNTKAWEF